MAKAMREQGYNTAKIQSEVMKLLRADPEFKKAVAENTKAYKQEVKEIIDILVKEKVLFACLTDHDTLNGTLEFIKLCNENNICKYGKLTI